MPARKQSFSEFKTSGWIFIGFVIAAGLGAIAHAVYRLRIDPIDPQWYLLAGLTLVSGSTTVKLPSIPATISVSETFVFASVLLFGQSAGTITVALDGLVISFWMAQRRPEWYRALFNTAAPAVSIWCASALLFSVPGIVPLVKAPSTVNALIVPLALFTALYFGLNSGLITVAVALETGRSHYRIWRENFRWVSLNYFGGASVALLLVVYTRQVDIRFIGVIIPLLLVLYFTFKTAMQLVEDANRHVLQVNRLYLSTIETLAMAIDAKDQITHGHIRRVQSVAIALAERLGVTDESTLKAIGAAALLHDTGKLAIPEYILNKPGKLSSAEFEKMKRHVTVGAEIISAIDFPYPVVPIVRCHHENWDGTGYPGGLRGTDIPIGARILSVVDCFDALTSDRPYRARLRDSEALEILQERRGTMYDPLVVDTFTEVYREITVAEPVRRANDQSSELDNPLPGIETPGSATLTDETMNDLCSQEGWNAIAHILDDVIPHTICVFYIYSPAQDTLTPLHASGNRAAVGAVWARIVGVQIDLGQRLTGWVAANRVAIVNSDPVLDLGDVARTQSAPLRSSLSAPLLIDDELLGVVTLYSASANAFHADHLRELEALTDSIAHAVNELAPRA